MKYGIDQFALDMETFLKAKLNEKIQALNTLYNDDYAMSELDSEAYFFQGLDDSVANFSPFLLHSVDNPNLDGSAAAGVIETYRYLVLLCLNLDNEEKNQGMVMMRYNRALKELFQENYGKIGRSKKIEIAGLETAGFASINSTQQCRTTAVILEVTFGN